MLPSQNSSACHGGYAQGSLGESRYPALWIWDKTASCRAWGFWVLTCHLGQPCLRDRAPTCETTAW